MKDNDYNVKAEYWRKIITQCNNRSSDISKAEWLDQHVWSVYRKDRRHH